ncbi:probable calcium-binding protein CML25 [Cicer arietinum]|uniref:Probable calcium-binding protein CML25 n=1 Tax=Cicer arietinum TaxID=3827 RepID=A0A1S2YDU9_CICAR|nr:probable calcium-binding protein CML25 [Cicer arietinum]
MGLKSLFNRPKDMIPSASSTPSRSTSLSVHSRARLAGELEQVFKKFDVNGDGKISASELGSIMGSLGQPATEQELDNMIREVDGDGDGCISLQEFIELNTKGVDSDEILENLKDAFAVFDMDGNGSITAEELNTVMRSLGEECSLAECRRMIGGVDSDGDGMIDFEEFRMMMMMGSRHDTTDRVKPEPME